MSMNWTAYLALLPDVVAEEGPVIAAVDALEAVPKDQRKPSDYMKLLASILTITQPLADDIAAKSAQAAASGPGPDKP